MRAPRPRAVTSSSGTHPPSERRRVLHFSISLPGSPLSPPLLSWSTGCCDSKPSGRSRAPWRAYPASRRRLRVADMDSFVEKAVGFALSGWRPRSAPPPPRPPWPWPPWPWAPPLRCRGRSRPRRASRPPPRAPPRAPPPRPRSPPPGFECRLFVAAPFSRLLLCHRARRARACEAARSDARIPRRQRRDDHFSTAKWLLPAGASCGPLNMRIVVLQ